MDHQQDAEEFLLSAGKAAATYGSNAQIHASIATAHAVLALIDIITGDRENEIQEAQSEILDATSRIYALEQENRHAHQRVRELADQLDGCNDTLRRHEQAAANAAKTNNDLRKSYE